MPTGSRPVSTVSSLASRAGSAAAGQPDSRLLGLDALRGLAAVIVVLFHMGFDMAGAHLAVDFFFMLSGYVMARTYEQRLRVGTLTPAAFLIKRYARLWPPMALGTALGFAVHAGLNGVTVQSLTGFALLLALIPAFNLGAAPYLYNLPLWSIVYELIANALHALFLAKVRTSILWWIIAAAVLGLAWSIATVGFPRGGFPQYHLHTVFRVIVSYFLGVALYRRFGDTAPFRVPFWLTLAALPLYVLIVRVWPWNWAPLVFILVIAPLMLIGGIGVELRRGAQLASQAGAVSFPLYALHYPVLHLLSVALVPGLIGLALAGALFHVHRARRRVSAGALREESVPA